MKRLLALVAAALMILTITISPAEVADTNQAEVTVLAKSGASWDGNALPNYGTGRPEVTILRIKIPPGVTLDLHQHPEINAGVLLSGQLTVVTKQGKILNLKAGEALVEVVNTWHYGKNEGCQPAEIIVFYAGTVGTPVSIKE